MSILFRKITTWFVRYKIYLIKNTILYIEAYLVITQRARVSFFREMIYIIHNANIRNGGTLSLPYKTTSVVYFYHRVLPRVRISRWLRQKPNNYNFKICYAVVKPEIHWEYSTRDSSAEYFTKYKLDVFSKKNKHSSLLVHGVLLGNWNFRKHINWQILLGKYVITRKIQITCVSWEDSSYFF